MVSSGKYGPRTIGSQPNRDQTPAETDPETERVRLGAKGNPFAKHYGTGKAAGT